LYLDQARLPSVEDLKS
jgi:hypothetical protein